MDYNNYLNPTLVSIKPSGIRKFFSIAEEMDNVISSEILKNYLEEIVILLREIFDINIPFEEKL